MAKTKPKIQNELTKEISGTKSSSTGVRTGPRPTYGHDIKTSKTKETLPKPADSVKNKKLNLAFSNDIKYPKETTLEEREEIEEVEEDGRENIPGGKAVGVDLMKRASAPKREAEDHTGAPGPMSRTP